MTDARAAQIGTVVIRILKIGCPTLSAAQVETITKAIILAIAEILEDEE